MACFTIADRSVTLSDDGTVYSFGFNGNGKLGLGFCSASALPSPIPNLPTITQISCGFNFTACIDEEGFMWSIGKPNYMIKGINTFRPQKVKNIPLVHSISCGMEHVLIITNDSNLWSWGRNDFGELCLGNKKNQVKPEQTSFSNISKIFAGNDYSLFQNNAGDIFACGNNTAGQLGLDHKNHPQIEPCRIVNQPENIIYFCCAINHSLFLDIDGNVYSVGKNLNGQLGLGHNTDQAILNQIQDIPPMKMISCIGFCSYLLDFDGNVWSFGSNSNGQLGHDNIFPYYVPTIIPDLKNIQQISKGCLAYHFLAMDFDNKIFTLGDNSFGQLGDDINKSKINKIPKKLNSHYFSIWGNLHECRVKSARK